jgi:hypothetical protein
MEQFLERVKKYAEGSRHQPGMTADATLNVQVDEATAAVIRQVFEDSGELSAVIEHRRHFPALKDNENALLCVRAIVGWKPLPPLPAKRLRARHTRSSTP